jgi:hypothetical protein
MHYPVMTERQVAARWKVSLKTLRRWRLDKEGPIWHKLFHHVRYPPAEKRRRPSTTGCRRARGGSTSTRRMSSRQLAYLRTCSQTELNVSASVSHTCCWSGTCAFQVTSRTLSRPPEKTENRDAWTEARTPSLGRSRSRGKDAFQGGTGKKNPNRIRVGISHYGGGGGNRTRVRKPSTDSSTYLVVLFNLTTTSRSDTVR